MKFIETLREGERINDVYLCKYKQSAVTKNGKPYENVILQDKTGTIDAKIWEPNSMGIDDFEMMDYVAVMGDVSSFQGALQVSIKRVRKVREGEYDPANYLPVSEYDIEDMYAQLLGFVNGIKNPYLSKVARHFFVDDAEFVKQFKFSSAAKSVHHGFLGGLLMHTCNMLRLADFLAGLYVQTVDRSLLVAGTLLHDFSKAEEFNFSTLGLVTDYSLKGQLLGHLVMGAREVAELCDELGVPEEKSILLQHMLLSHHGQPEFGAAVLPQCAESELLYLIDSVDSRMEIYQEALDETPVGTFSKKIFALDKRIYRHW